MSSGCRSLHTYLAASALSYWLWTAAHLSLKADRTDALVHREIFFNSFSVLTAADYHNAIAATGFHSTQLFDDALRRQDWMTNSYSLFDERKILFLYLVKTEFYFAYCRSFETLHCWFFFIKLMSGRDLFVIALTVTPAYRVHYCSIERWSSGHQIHELAQWIDSQFDS